MRTYAAAAVPWHVVVTGCVLVPGLLALVAWRPSVVWPLQGAALGVVGGVAAWSMDEPLAALVDTLPRALTWRTVARCCVVPLVLVAWAVPLVAARDRLPAHLPLFLLQGAGAVLVALAVTVALRRRGAPSPGRRVASIAVPAALALALIRPAPRRLALFPVWPTDAWATSAALWSLAAAAAALVLAGALLREHCPRRVPIRNPPHP